MRRQVLPASLRLALVLAALGLAAAAQAASARELTLGFGDPAFRGSQRDVALDRALAANASVVRIGAAWSSIAPTRPADPTNPADPAYRFSELDASVHAADARGLRVLLEVGNAPRWAEGPDRPPLEEARSGTWRPDPVAYGEFARAIAARYRGGFSPGIGQAPLPAVNWFQAGNEPNLSTYLTPQSAGGRIESARIYRELLTSFYAGVKAVDAGNLVVSAGTGPYGGATQGGSPRTHPIPFLRELLCLNGKTLADAGCSAPVPLDALAHHPINAGRPFASAENPDDATTPDIDRIRKVLRAAERKRRVAPAGGRPIWVTEFWWESDPPDTTYGVAERKHARYIAEALYLFWKQRVQVVLGFQLADAPFDPSSPGSTFQTGLYFADGTAKDALTAYRFPLVALRARRGTKLWGRAPEGGRLTLEIRRRGRWRRIERIPVDAGEIFRERLRGRGQIKARARVGSERSLPYRAARR